MLALFPLIKLRNAGSVIIGRKYEKTDWKPDAPNSLSELSRFCRKNFQYKPDPARGLLDHIQPVAHMNWQLKNRGKIEGDCDDMATYVGDMLKRMGYKNVFRVNIPKYRHVICVFKDGDLYRYFSNQIYRPGPFNSVYEAVSHWCGKKEHKPTKVYYSEKI